MGLNTEKNKEFIQNYEKKFGPKKPINAIGEATYDAVWLYSLAVEKAGSTNVEKVIPALSKVEFEDPQGHVNISAQNNQMVCKIGRASCRERVCQYGKIG